MGVVDRTGTADVGVAVCAAAADSAALVADCAAALADRDAEAAEDAAESALAAGDGAEGPGTGAVVDVVEGGAIGVVDAALSVGLPPPRAARALPAPASSRAVPITAAVRSRCRVISQGYAYARCAPSPAGVCVLDLLGRSPLPGPGTS